MVLEISFEFLMTGTLGCGISRSKASVVSGSRVTTRGRISFVSASENSLFLTLDRMEPQVSLVAQEPTAFN